MLFRMLVLFTIFFIFQGCNRSMENLGDVVPLALRGDESRAYQEPPGSVLLTETGEDGVVSLYDAEGIPSNCRTGALDPPSSFGSEGPEAFLTLCSSEEVNRFRNLEIRFSHAMDRESVESALLITQDGQALPGPHPGGSFIWRSPRRLFFDPYRELNSFKNYNLQIQNTARTTDGTPIRPFSQDFSTAHDYLVEISLTQGAVTIPAGGSNDLSFHSGQGDVIVQANFASPEGAFEQIQKILINRMGNVDSLGNPNASAKVICTEACSDLGTPLNLTGDPAFLATGMNVQEGGNTYYFEITTRSGAKFHRYFSFNWGNIQNPNNLINNVASGVLDQAQMLKMLERLVEIFTENKFRVTGKTFNDFASQPKASGKNTAKCINYGSFDFIQNYGDNPIGGYCGGDGDNPGGFVASTWAGCFGSAELDMDVYVSNIYIPPYSNGNPTVEANMAVNSNGEVGIDLIGRKAFITLEIVAKNRDSMLCLVGAGNRFHFRTNIELNPTSNFTQRLARARNSLGVDSQGNLSLLIKTPHLVTDGINGNFFISQWVDNLQVEGMDMVNSTNWVTNILSPITEIIADQLVPQVKAQITQVVLKSIVQTVAPNVLNAIVGTLKAPGIDISLPPYLPAPLGNYPLNVKVQLSSDAAVRVSGANRGIVSSVHAAISAKNPHPTPRQHANTMLCNPLNGCVVYTKNSTLPLVPVNTSPAFEESATRPGFLLSMHSDAITQAAYHLWKNRAIDLNVDSAFIASVNSYAGNDPLLKLTDSILRVSAITSIIAPGRNTLEGLDGSNNLLPAMCGGDDVRFKIDPIMPPVARMIDNTNFNPNSSTDPNIQVSFSDMQLTIQGRRTDASEECVSKRGNPDNAYYTMATIRVSMNGRAAFRFVDFDNPNTPANEFQNALSLRVFTSGLAYAMEVLEGPANNPYGLDPHGIKSVFSPLVTSLVVPLVNSILNKVPLPASIPFQALSYPSSATACQVSAKRDHSIQFNSLAVPAVDRVANPYLYAQVELKGNALTDPKFLLEANCR
jgi:hypothetical protein